MKFYQQISGLIVIGVASLASVAQAALVISDLGDTLAGTGSTLTNPYKSQGFGANISGIIDSITVQLTFNAAAVTDGSSASVYILTADSSGQPDQTISSATLLGTITALVAGSQQYTLSTADNDLANYTLNAGNSYALAVDISLTGAGGPTVGFDYTSTGAGYIGNGVLEHAYNGNGTTWSVAAAHDYLMSVDVMPAPEPSPSALFGFGCLTLLAFLRKKTWPECA